MRAALAAILLCAASVCPAQPKTVVPFKVEILDTGVFEVVGSVTQRPAPSTASGTVSEHEELRLVQAGLTVKAERGVTFGFRYRLVDVPDGLVTGLQMRALHPAMRGPDGRISRTSSASTEAFGVNGEAFGDVAYTLSEPFEVLRGDWELQLLYHGSLILSRKFRLQ